MDNTFYNYISARSEKARLDRSITLHEAFAGGRNPEGIQRIYNPISCYSRIDYPKDCGRLNP